MEVFDRWRTWDDARADLAGTGLDADRVGRAAAAAVRWHGDQRRPTGAPYLEHLLEALEVLVRGAGETDPDVLAAVLLHDVVEDTPATTADVEAEFGPRVAELVDWVTKPPAGGAGRQAKRAAKSAYLRRLRDAPRDAVRVKLADRVSNVQTLDRMPPDFQRRYYAETVTYILPLTRDEPWFASWYAGWRERYAHLL
ncbi:MULTISPECIES: HD domain-containing protein [Actinomadura]|uniref:HD domain-containing protein n=1 Tax=Actinomadura TaxID=1988 RepID=UPI0004063E55|nr:MULTISPECIES: HD domain-containing protein [Actinomadura]RSN41639.1 bifunctional (p)ppGpp synthetase/guanosine-3',5'-bis(diphosphate) 3'-pyrophosphohydrolase [Actinomadura sp. WAC 06369]